MAEYLIIEGLQNDVCMRLLLIEKDKPSLGELESLVNEAAPHTRIAGRLTTVGGITEWLRQNDRPDLVIAAVQLADGLIIPILKQFVLPVIYISSRKDFAVEAFKTDGVDYLLQPVTTEDLREAIRKYERIFTPAPNSAGKNKKQGHRERFVVTVGQQMKLINAGDIAYFYTEHKVVYLVTFDGTKYTTDFTLGRLEQLLDPALFFRINRQFIVNIHSIVKMRAASKSRLELTLRPETKYDTVTSFERTPDFRKWLVGGD